MHNVNVNFSRTSSRSLNHFAFVEDVAGNAGITGVSTDPFDWGVPQLSFSSLSSVRDMTPTRRTDKRLHARLRLDASVGTKHTLRIGGDVRLDDRTTRRTPMRAARSCSPACIRRADSTTVRGGGLDFADFLLGMPQQATVQYGPGQRAHVAAGR